MSFFRPHKRHPRQFNYVPRYYDPVKEERDRRRRELHGTSSATDDEEYAPGKYIRTQREARDASRGEGSPVTGILQYLAIAFVLGFAMLGLSQWIRRKDIRLVDRSILILGGFYLVVAAVKNLLTQ